MSEEKQKVEETVEEINPIDEYLNNYKEQKLAEFCVQKDKEIENRKNERKKLLEQITEMKHKVEIYDKCFDNTSELYKKIKEMPVDKYLKLYNMFIDDITQRDCVAKITTTIPTYIPTYTSSTDRLH